MSGLSWLSGLSLLGGLCPAIALAQVSPDSTLPTTVSTPDGLNFTIDAGAQVGSNLFHSFQTFSVPTGGSAVFNNAVNVQNIIGRVTGGNISNIDGLIAANGTANLFLINPAGIVFGPNASLSIGGSFIASTANSMQFADGAEFSAINPAAPLLTVSVPTGLQLGQNPAAIEVQGGGNNLILDFDGYLIRDFRPSGLEVLPGRTLALVGGDVNLTGGNLTAPAGRIELGSVAEGTVRLNSVGSNWTLDYAGVSAFRDIQLTQAASLDTSGIGSGAMRVQGRSVLLKDGSAILGHTLGNQSGADLVVQATERVELSGKDGFDQGSLIHTQVEPGARANAGNLIISAPQLQLADGGTFSSVTFGRGNSGNLTIRADDISLSGSDIKGTGSVLNTMVGVTGIGNAGNMTIDTNRFQLQDGASVFSAVFGRGNSGNVTVRAADVVEISGINDIEFGGTLTTQLRSGAIGNTGNLTIDTRQLLLRDGAIVSADTFGRGNGGNVTIRASELVELRGFNTFGEGSFLTTLATGTGNSGDLTIDTGRLRIQDGSVVSTSVFGRGNGGNLTVRATDAVELSGLDQGGFSSILTTQVTRRGVGNAGNLTIATNQLRLQDGAQISSSVFGRGNGGDLTIRAADSVQLSGTSRFANSSLGTSVEARGQGNAGNLSLETGRLTLQDGAIITSGTRGVGNGGNVTVRAADSIELSGFGIENSTSRIETVVHPGARGNAGTLTVDAGRLRLQDQAAISSETAGLGNANNLVVQARDSVFLTGNSRFSTRSRGGGETGNLTVTTNQLTLEQGSQFVVSSQGAFPAGNLTVNANSVRLSQASFSAETEAGDRGSIFVNAQDIILRRNSTITANATKTATGGNITINSDLLVLLENSAIVAQAVFGRGGNITITTRGLIQSLGTRIDATSQLGINGVVQINTPDVDPSRQLVELPSELIDSQQLIANSCLVPSTRQQGTFILTGVGGLPAIPTSPARSSFATYDIPASTTTSAQPPPISNNTPITEIENIYRLENGQLILGRRCL